jgi:hypothetical protein
MPRIAGIRYVTNDRTKRLWRLHRRTNLPPLVSILIQANGDFFPPTSLSVAVGGNPDESVLRVDLYDGAVLLERTNAPFGFTWLPHRCGEHNHCGGHRQQGFVGHERPVTVTIAASDLSFTHRATWPMIGFRAGHGAKNVALGPRR